MFGLEPKKLAAQARILDAGKSSANLTRLRGLAYGTFDYQVELSLPGETECRAVASGQACSACRPKPGDIIDVSFDPNEGRGNVRAGRDPALRPGDRFQANGN